MTTCWQRNKTLFGLAMAVLFAPPSASRAEDSTALPPDALPLDHAWGLGLNVFLFLPFGLLLAALVLEAFAVWKKNREIEPGVLFLIFAGTIAAGASVVFALMFLNIGRETGELSRFNMWMVFVGVLGCLAFYLKRKCRNQGLLTLGHALTVATRREPPRTSSQKTLIVGYRFMLGLAILTAFITLGQLPLKKAPVVAFSQLMKVKKGAVAKAEPAPATTSTPVAAPAPAAAPGGTTAASLADLLAKRPDGGNIAAAPAPAEPSAPAPVEPAAPAPATAPPAAPADAAAAPMAVADAGMTKPAMADAAAPAAPAPAVAAPAAPAAAPAAPAAAATPVVSMKLPKDTFAKFIKPVIDSKCVSCHGSTKQKGDLRLDSIDFIKKGANGRPVIAAGVPDNSSLYTKVILPPDDPDIMPPTGKGQPYTKAQAEALKQWIIAGADFGDGAGLVAAAAGAGNLKAGGKAEEARAAKLAPPDPGLVGRLTTAGVLVRPLSSNGALLDIDYSHAELSQIKLEELIPIAKNVYTLDLSKTKVKDDGLAPVAQMTNLTKLLLNKTTVSDAALVHLKGLNELETLNLYGTQVTDAGLTNLGSLKKLTKLFLFSTKCTEAGANQLKAQIPTVSVNLGDG